MSLTNDVIAAWTLALLSPALVFLSALYIRQLQRLESEPARTAERIVTWFAAHPHFGLWVVLVLFPFSAFMLGSGALVRTWGDNPQLREYTWRALWAIPNHWPAVFIGGATLLSAGMLMMIAAHISREFRLMNEDLTY